SIVPTNLYDLLTSQTALTRRCHIEDRDERSKRELEAVAYVVGRYFELDMSGAAFYLAAWNGDDPEAISDRLGRISHTAQELIDSLEQELERASKAEAKTGEAE
ncbi:hypothetical protein ACFQE6_09625, partial [Natrinema soli]